MKLMAKRAALAAGLITAMLLPLTAFAHHPVLEREDIKGYDDAPLLPDLESSYAVYAKLENGDVDFYRFEVKGPAELKIGLLVPKAKGYENFYPAFAVIGPGLSAPDPGLDIALPEGAGAVVITGKPGEGERPTFYEPFSMTSYYKGIDEYKAKDPANGTYYIAVFHPRGEAGSYCLSFGSGEKWRWSDIPQTVKDVFYIKFGQWLISRENQD